MYLFLTKGAPEGYESERVYDFDASLGLLCAQLLNHGAAEQLGTQEAAEARAAQYGDFLIAVAANLSQTRTAIKPSPKYPRPPVQAPADNPTLPVGSDVFNPTLTASPANNTPTAYKSTPDADQDRTVVIAVDGTFSGFEAYGQTTSGNGTFSTCTVLRPITGVGASVVVPASLPINSMYLVWPKSGTARGLPMRINGTELHWLGVTKNAIQYSVPGTAVVGDTCSIYGRNLNGVDATKLVYIDSYGWVTATDVNPERAQFTVPTLATPGTSTTSVTLGTGSKTFTTQSSLGYATGQRIRIMQGETSGVNGYMTGTVTSYSGTTLVVDVTEAVINSAGTGDIWYIFPGYYVYAHNGHGGAYGWSSALELFIAPAYTYDTTINMDDYTQPDAGDNLAGWNSCIAAASAAGARVKIVLEAGTYHFSGRPNDHTGGFGRGIWLCGAGKGTTNLEPLSGFSAANLIYASSSRSKVSDLSIDFTNGTGSGSSPILDFAIAVNVEVFDLRYNSMDRQGPIWVEGSDFTGGTVISTMIFAQSSTDSTVLNCTFRQCNNVGSAVYFTMPLRVSISGCTCQDYNVGGTNAERGGGRFVIFNAPATHWYVGENETILLAAPETGVDQNTGEQILLEAPQGLDSYDVVSATANTVTVSAGFDGYTNWHVFIVGGKGVGQFARILSRSGATYTLDRNFVVIPDATSRVNIVASAIDGAIYNNTLQGNSNFNGASSAFSTFVGGGGIVFDGNNCSLFNYGTMLWSPDAAILAGPCSCPLFFSEHRNNTFTGCNYGHRMVAVGPSDGETYTFLGVTYRDDVYTGCVAVDLYLNMQDDLALDLTAFDHCSWTDAPKGIYAPVASTLGQLVLYASSFALGTGTFSGSIASAPNGVTLTNSGTTFTGFQS